MRLDRKVGIVAAVTALLVVVGAFGLGSSTPSALADVTKLRILTEQGIDPAPGTTTPRVDCDGFATGARAPGTAGALPAPTEVVAVGGTIIICVNITAPAVTTGDDLTGKVTFDSNDIGSFKDPSCAPGGTGDDGDVRTAEWPDDECVSVAGVGTDEMIIEAAPVGGGGTNFLDVIMAKYTCPVLPANTTITVSQSDAGGENTAIAFAVSCRGNAGGLTLTATPTTVEIIPAASNTAHSLIQVTVTDSLGTAILVAPGTEVDFTTDRCGIEESNVDTAAELLVARATIGSLSTSLPFTYFNWDSFANSFDGSDLAPSTAAEGVDTTASSDQTGAFDFDIGSATSSGNVLNRSMAAAILHCDPHSGVTNATPGVATVQVCIDVVGALDICRTVQVTVIGPPASITVAASPTSLRCGEKSTITVTVKDAIGQNVSDHTVVELVTNLGGTIGGTGGVASGFGLVSPISSNGAGTFGGVATAFLLTSESHSGPYEVVATTGGTSPFNDGSSGIQQTTLGGIFSTPPISAQVTVTCTIPAPIAPTAAATVTAPRTGTGITPPNTGDAGLAGSSSSSRALFAIGGMAAFALAGLASLKFARR